MTIPQISPEATHALVVGVEKYSLRRVGIGGKITEPMGHLAKLKTQNSKLKRNIFDFWFPSWEGLGVGLTFDFCLWWAL